MITPFAPPQICESAHQVPRLVFFLVLPTAYSQDPCTDFHDQYVIYDAVSCKDVPFGGFENKIIHLDPIFPPKRKFFANFRRD